jgi:hypothetical protein
MAKRLALADGTTTDAPSSDSEEEPAKPSSRVRLKSQPIPIPIPTAKPDRRAALRQSLSLPIDSEED